MLLLTALVPWLAQPPLVWWPLAFIAAIPLIWIAESGGRSRRMMLGLYAASFLYWAVTLQGLRHAHPLIYPCWLALAGYLGLYPIAFVVLLRRTRRWLPLEIAGPCVWVAMECLRNYLLTGLSAVMLGHTLADVPVLIQIADIGGTYAVSGKLVIANVGLYRIGSYRRVPLRALPAVALALAVLSAAFGYGRNRMSVTPEPGATSFALIARNETVEYVQDEERQIELYQAYARQSQQALRESEQPIDAVVWPESMFSGDLLWTAGEGSQALADREQMTLDQVKDSLRNSRRSFEARAQALQSWLALENGPDQRPPHLVVGCGVIHYGETIDPHSGIVHVDPSGSVVDWYAKMHLVMFGEYVPIVSSIPGIRKLIPGSMGLTPGETAVPMQLNDYRICPNICVETAVERVAVNHVRQLLSEDRLPNAIVTVTNGGWFDQSSVVQHHKRCAQFVAVTTRRDVLSAANNGPTAWIDRHGQIVEE
ncbi:MAG: apolipoprotein N-acyltransferase, partial [Planctomycetota bacterium]